MTLDYKKLIDFIFPPSDDELLLKGVTEKDFIHIYNIREHNKTISLLPYSDRHVQSAVHLLKFHNQRHARKLLSAVLRKYLQTTPDETIVIPIPLSKKRLRERGYNQVTELIMESLAEKLERNILIRSRHTVAQTTLHREERLTNLKDAFAIKNIQTARKITSGKHIVLIDDVTTTGTTLKVAKAALLPLQPHSITCVALAH